MGRIDNKLAPIPGTQLALEKKHEDDLKEYEDKKGCDRQDREKALAFKLHVKQQSAGLHTQVHFDTMFGQTIDKIEETLNENEELLHYNHVVELADDLPAITKFQKNVESGSHFYIGYAVSNGFQSIDYTDPTTGNSFLHMAVRKGHVQVVEELLKYKANPDVKNKLGHYPVHQAWLFWKTHALRTKEERLEQEDRTCRLLLHLFSYGAYVDAADLDLQTALHIACRLGTVKAVKIMLTFQCNMDLLTARGQSAADIALEFRQNEIHRLLLAWKNIKSYLIQSDFHTVWHKFLHEYEASINISKPAEAIMSELELEQNARHMARAGRENMVFVDDPLLLQALQASRSIDTSGKVPKPWEKDWKKYVKLSKAAGVLDLKTKLETLKGKVKGTKKSSGFRKGFNEADKRRNQLPDRPTPLQWSERQRILSGDVGNGMEDSLGMLLTQGAQPSSTALAVVDDEVSVESEASSPSLFSISRFNATMSTDSALHQRRQHFAQKVALDAKFLKFTKRLTQHSALSLPLRTPQAPLDGTEEGNSAMRMILAQGFEFERLEKYKQRDRFAELLGMQRSPTKDKLGAYSEEVQFSKLNPRDVLYDSLFLAAQAAAAGASTEEEKEERESLFPSLGAAPSKPNVKVEPDKRSKVDLVGDKRPRYVDRALLPSKQEATVVEIMIREQKAKDEAERLRKLNLGTEKARDLARQEMEAAIAGAQSSLEEVVSNGNEKSAMDFMAEDNRSLRAVSRQRRRIVAEKVQSLNRMFLQKEVVKYGQGRLTSSHNMTGKIEEPWTTVGGRYATRAGDRTV